MATQRDNMSYKDIKRVVLDRIQKRIWAPDSLLPSEIELADEFSSTRTTVNRALRELAEEGFLERKRKAGTRVLNAPLLKAQLTIPQVGDEIIEAGRTYRYSLVKREVIDIPSWLSATLATGSEQSVLYLECMHFADNTPFQFEVRWIVVDSARSDPARLCASLPMPVSACLILSSASSIFVTWSRPWASLRNASDRLDVHLTGRFSAFAAKVQNASSA